MGTTILSLKLPPPKIFQWNSPFKYSQGGNFEEISRCNLNLLSLPNYMQ